MKIGIFDSGVGGLSVLLEFLKRNTDNDYIYFGDTSRVPYGNKSSVLITNYSLEISDFLVSEGVDMIVVACGTATSVALNELKKKFDIPVIGVIEPTTEYVNSNNLDNILLIGTFATVNSNSWQILTDNNIYMKACPMFVPMIEEGIKDDKIINEIVDYYLKDFKDKDIKNLILGCTHYPFITDYLNSYFNNINIINMGDKSAKIVEECLNNKGKIKLYFSDLNDTVNKFINSLLSDYEYEIIEKIF